MTAAPAPYRSCKRVGAFTQAVPEAQTDSMFVEQQAMRASLRRSHRWAGLSCAIYDVFWIAAPGWSTWTFEQPALCLLVEEVGGRAELRSEREAPAKGEYFGAGHLTFLSATDPITLYSSSLRRAQFACFAFHPRDADCLTVAQAELIERASSRVMFHDARLNTCAQMLSAYDSNDERDAYGLGLQRALLAALLGVVGDPPRHSEDRLTGRPLARVFNYIDEHLHDRVPNESLAQLANIPPTQFGPAFRQATGLSPQRWQMDARVRFAQRLMVDDPAPSLALIAVRSGFADQSHFSRAFLDIIGVTPTAWLHQRR